MATDDQKFLQAMFKEQCDQARQHENMRQQSTTLVVAVSAALATVSGTAISATVNPLLDADVPWVLGFYALLGVVVIKLAELCKGLSLKHYERNRMHVERAKQYRNRLWNLFPSADYSKVNDAADVDHEMEWTKDGLAKSIIDERLHKHWINIYRYVWYLGIALIAIPIFLAIALTWNYLGALVAIAVVLTIACYRYPDLCRNVWARSWGHCRDVWARLWGQ